MIGKGCFYNIRGACGDKWQEQHHAASSSSFHCVVSTYREGGAYGLMHLNHADTFAQHMFTLCRCKKLTCKSKL